jgi:sigma-B regulation protein RsbU (phosphoserine phosphatase)
MVSSTFSPDLPESESIAFSCDFTQILMKVQRATQSIASTLDFETLLDRVVHDIAGTIGNVEVSVWLVDESTGDFVLSGVNGCTQYHCGHRLQVGMGMVGYSAASGEVRYAPDVRNDPYYISCEPETRSEITVPLIASGRIMGVLAIDHCRVNAFDSDQIAVLRALAGNIAIAIENARMFRSEREQRERMTKESADARAMQQALFLKPVPLVPGFAFETAWHPAGAVAGDWFDFIDLGEQKYAIVLADVSGKGMSAALLMSATRALLRSIAPQFKSPSQMLENLNQRLIDDFPTGKFVTMVLGVLDASSRQLTFASAGHPAPLLINHHCAFIDLDTGLPLGLGPSSYPQSSITLSPSSSVLLYTDGITEAANRTDEEYGPKRLLEHFQLPEACVEGLIEEVQRFSHGSEHIDDATAVLIRSR